MGGHNRPCPSLRWVELDDEQIVWKSGSCVGSANSVMNGAFGWMVTYRAAELGLMVSCAGLADLTPRRGLVYDAN
jgi:hypothetical protein